MPHHHYEDDDDRREYPYNNVPNLATWLQFGMVIGAMVLSWTTLNTTITKIDVKQTNIISNFDKLDESFDNHMVVHRKDYKELSNQVDSVERSISQLY